MIPLAPLPQPPFIPASIPSIFPKDPVDNQVATEQERYRVDLDARLPRWQGPAESLSTPIQKESGIPGSGWWLEDLGPGGLEKDWLSMAVDILMKIRKYKDAYGERIAQSIEAIPETARVPFLSFNHPVSFRTIEGSLQNGAFLAPKYFDMEMMRLFERARRYYRSGGQSETKAYGNTLALQRLYQALTSTYENPSIEYMGFSNPNDTPVPAPSPSSHAFIPAGPGLAKPTPDSGKNNYEAYEFTGLRIVTKDRTATPEARWKGVGWKTGDYVHLVNPEDPSRPIIGQIFRSFFHAKGPKQHWITVCWYYRPEQTWHNPMQMFYEKEICKTGIMVEHPVEDIIERVGCQFYTKYARGRPQSGEWYPGWPLYVCNSRYNEDRRGEERGNHFVKIKNWGSCVPEELRKTNFMQIVEFEKAPLLLRMEPSPFLRGLTMCARGIPGGISWDVKIEGQEDSHAASAAAAGASLSKPLVAPPPEGLGEDDASDRKRPRMMGHPSVGGEAGPSTPAHGPRSRDGSIMQGSASPAARGPINLGTPNMQTPGPSVPSVSRRTNTNAPPSHHRGIPPLPVSVIPAKPLGPAIPLPSGSFIAAKTLPDLYGSVDSLNRWCDVEPLPAQTVPLFDREPGSNRVLWFSGPPLDLDVPERPSHSGKYLTFLAKRKFDAVSAGEETSAVPSAITGESEVGFEDGGFWGKEEELKALLFGEK